MAGSSRGSSALGRGGGPDHNHYGGRGGGCTGRRSSGALVFCGDNAFHSQRWADAVRHYECATDLSPDSRTAVVYRDWGHCLFQLGRFDEAMSVLNTALELDPRYHAALEDRMRLHWEKRRFAQTVADAARLLELRPRHVDALLHRPKALGHLGLRETAMADLQMAVGVAPLNSLALCYYADALREAGGCLRPSDRCVRPFAAVLTRTMWRA
jgi:tetratricopeptide (TPR) repeat protein